MNDRKILIIDDEPLILENLTQLFSGADWLVESCYNGAQALDKIKKFEPSVILSDINMPEMTGLQLLDRIFKTDVLIPVILLTGYRDAEKMQQAWEACVFDLLDKPYDADYVLKVADCAHDYGKEYILSARERVRRIRGKAPKA